MNNHKLSDRIVTLLLLIAFSLMPSMAQDNVIDRVEWVVGDKAIPRSDIEQAIEFWVENDQKFDGDPYCVVGEDLAAAVYSSGRS